MHANPDRAMLVHANPDRVMLVHANLVRVMLVPARDRLAYAMVVSHPEYLQSGGSVLGGPPNDEGNDQGAA